MKVIVTGITGMRNRGVEAILVPTLGQLKSRDADLDAIVLTNTPDYDRIRLAPTEVQVALNEVRRFSRTRFRRPLLKATRLYEPLLPKYRRVVNWIRTADVILASGGDVFCGDSGHVALQGHLRPLELALGAGVPVVFLTQSIGPFRTEADKQAWLRVGRRASLIIAREKRTFSYLKDELGLPGERLHVTADPAFLLDPIPAESVDKLRRIYGLEQGRPTVALGMSQAITNYSGEDHSRHLQSWIMVVKWMLRELDVQILLVPHVQEISPNNDDRVIATRILRELAFNPRLHLAGADHSAAEFKGLIASCDLVISERMHACIAGLSSGICTMAIGYSVKAEGILADMLGRETLDDGLLVPVKRFLDPKVACEQVQRAWERREEVATLLVGMLPRIKKEAARTFDLIYDTIS